MSVKKEECLRILKDLKEEVKMWEWDFDYYKSGKNSAGEQIDWTLDRLDVVIALVEASCFE